jgi:uncharacterized protein involved in response to NO
MTDLRREPFRAFFPLGLFLGAAGMVPWLFFGRGMLHAWPGLTHSLIMTQAFLVALAVGFLGTMLPRRANSAPLAHAELVVLAVALVGIPVAAQSGSVAATEVAFLIVLVTLGQYVVRSLRRARTSAPRRPPPSFVLLPLGVTLGATGAVLLILEDLHVLPGWAFLLGRQLAQQGLMLGLLLALVPMLAPILAHGAAPADPAPAAATRLRRWHLLAGLALALSFPVEQWLSLRLGLLLRGGVCAAELVLAGGLYRLGTRPGLHRWFFRLAVWSVPLGLVAAGLDPFRRVQLTHVTYIGGLSLVAFAISAHVTMLHTGADRLADRRPLLVLLAGALMLAAAVVRVGAESAPEHYLEALVLAASLWLAAATAWAAFLTPRLLASGESS